MPSSTESETWSQTLSGCPSVTDSDVRRNEWDSLKEVVTTAANDNRGAIDDRPEARGALLASGLKGSMQHLMKSRQGCLQEGGVIEARKVQTPTEAAHGRPNGGGVGTTSSGRVGDANRSPHEPVRDVRPKLHP